MIDMQSVSPTGTDGSRRTTLSLAGVVKTFLVGTRFTANWRSAAPIPDAPLAYRRRRTHGAAGEGRR
jgi:hypothetical protein